MLHRIITGPKTKRYALIFLLVFVAAFAHAQTPLVQIIKNHNYEPLTLPGTNWEVGTVITIKKGHEEIVASNHQCLDENSSAATLALPNYSYELSPVNEFELNLARLFGDNFDVGVAFKNKGIKKIVISMTGTQETVIPAANIKKKLDDFGQTSNEVCLDKITGKRNFVITRTLSVGTLSYAFINADGAKIALTAGFLKSMGMTDSLASKHTGKTALIISQRVFLGYKATRFEGFPGLEKTVIRPTDVTSVEMEDLKKRSSPVSAPKNLKYGILGYSYPPAITVGSSKTIHAFISIIFPESKVRDTLMKIVIADNSTQTGDSVVIVKAIRLFKKVTLTLDCMDTILKVTRIHPNATQEVDTLNGNKWSWGIYAKTADHPSSTLKLKITTGGPSSYEEKTLIINIKVEPKGVVIRRIYNYLINHPEVLVSSILIPVIGFLGARYLNRKKKKNEQGKGNT